MLTLGLLCTVFLGKTLCFVLNGETDNTATCTDSTQADCSLLDCQAFPEEASKYCPRTCGMCHNTASQNCVDSTEADCSLLDCQAFPDVASNYCPRTCGLCHNTATCTDSTQSDCSLLDCQAFPDVASNYCARTCGICHVCEDKPNTDCTVFTSQLLCMEPHLLPYAAEFCPKHCNFCSNTDVRI